MEKDKFKYTFEDGHIEITDHPLSVEEMRPFKEKYGVLKPDGLAVIKKGEKREEL